MKVVTDAGTIDLGTTETTPTIGITDYSVRTTDDFGVTSVTPRGFSRSLSTKILVETDHVDALQRQLTDLRATAAQWIADDRFAWLSVDGFYKDFSVELALPNISYCTLTIEGLAETEAGADPGGDPAPTGLASTLQLLQPITVTDPVLTASNVPEADAAEWNAAVSYAAGARVMRAATHRVYQSLSVHNQGDTPETSPAVWLDLGPTNRWAMFDQALGSATTGTSQIIVTFLVTSAITGLAVLDTDAGTVRVQAPGYDDIQPRSDAGAIVFPDLAVAAGASITVTINAAGGAAVPQTWSDSETWSDAQAWLDSVPGAGSGPVSVGTLLLGNLVSLGVTEASPTAGINDYSLKNTDDFGVVTVVPRAWSKQMTAKALIDTNAVDIVANRVAAVRAIPSLWIGRAGQDVLTIYGFFKDFSIEVSETTAVLSLTIEGLSTAPKIDPFTIDFDNVTGDDKPEAGATRNVPRGEWSPTAAYSQGDIVTYQGSSYLAGQDVPIGTYPTNALYWDLLAKAGDPGAPGVPGAPGSYVHIAYANSADGSQDFVAGTANPGRTFIGIYTDATPTGSTDYHVYNWSRLTGEDGLDGTNGTPGPVGPDGRQSYVHFAYADSVNGSLNFTTGDPGSRSFIGVYSDYTVPDSNYPSTYAWSLIKGADGATGGIGAPGANGTNGVDGLAALNIHTVGAVSWDGHNLLCPTRCGNWNTNGAYSSNVIPGGVALSFQRPNWYDGPSEDAFVGISSSPTASLDYTNVEFAWRQGKNTEGYAYAAEVWHAGTLLYVEGWAGGNTYSIRYDANTGIVTWYRNDAAAATYSVGTGRSFGFQATAAGSMSLVNVAFTAAGGTGAAGSAGPPGGKGDKGDTVVGPPGAPGTAGIGALPSILFTGAGTFPIGTITMPAGQTVTIESDQTVVAHSGSVSLTNQLSYSTDGTTWTVLDTESDDGESISASVTTNATYTNSTGAPLIISFRVASASSGAIYRDNGSAQVTA